MEQIVEEKNKNSINSHFVFFFKLLTSNVQTANLFFGKGGYVSARYTYI